MESKHSLGTTTLTDSRSAPIVDSIIRQLSKAELLVGLGQVDDAISTLKEILRLNPDSTHAHMKLKDVFLRAGMRAEAADECMQLARICDSQGETDAARDYIARAHLLSPATSAPLSTQRVSSESTNRVRPSSPTGSADPGRQPEPELRTSYEASTAPSRPEQPSYTRNTGAPQVNAEQSAKNPTPQVVSPTPSGPAPQNPALNAGQPPSLPGAAVPLLPIHRGSPPSKNHSGDLRPPPPNGKASLAPGPEHIIATVSPKTLEAVPVAPVSPKTLEAVPVAPVSIKTSEAVPVATVSPKTLEAVPMEAVSANPLSIVANPLMETRAATQTPIVLTAPSAKLIASSREKRGHARRWLYAAAAVLCLSAAGIAGLFWYDTRLDRDYAALNDQYEAISQATAVALAQPEIVEEVTAEQTEPSTTDSEDVQATKREQDSLDARKAEAQKTGQRVMPGNEPPSPNAGATVAALRPEKENRPLPPMTSQVTLPATVSQAADNRTLVPVGSALAGAPPPAPPPASPAPASKVVVPAEATSKSQPVYPRSAAMAGVGGSVSIQVSINERGAVIDARAVSGPALLRDAAVNAARRWRFTPSTIGGVPVKATKTIVFNFKADR